MPLCPPASYAYALKSLTCHLKFFQKYFTLHYLSIIMILLIGYQYEESQFVKRLGDDFEAKFYFRLTDLSTERAVKVSTALCPATLNVLVLSLTFPFQLSPVIRFPSNFEPEMF